MNIALIGYGKMGKEIERLAPKHHMKVKKIIDIDENVMGSALTKTTLKDIEICIDFSSPAATLDNVRSVADAGKNIVIGTTGWYDQRAEVEKIAKAKKIGLLYSPNFSLGMNIFFQIIHLAAKYVEKFPEYDVAVEEIHHRGKLDSPSGTALAIGQILLQHIHRKRELARGTTQGPVGENQLHISSTRVGSAVGKHTVVFDSEADCIELVHTAKSRTGFAVGALVAAEWLAGKKGVYTMKDVMNEIL